MSGDTVIGSCRPTIRILNFHVLSTWRWSSRAITEALGLEKGGAGCSLIFRPHLVLGPNNLPVQAAVVGLN